MPIITVKGKTNRTFTFPPLEVDEFLPLVEIVPEKVKDVQNNTFEIKGDELAPTETQVTLSKHLDADKRSYILQELTTDKTTLELEFKVTKGSTETWDGDGYIEPKLSITDPGIRITSATKLKQKYGDTFQLTLDIDSKETKTFYIDFFANDNEDDFNKGEYENVFCGRVQIVFYVYDRDVFSLKEITRLIDENEFLIPFADAATHPEYDENYCMQAAERGLSELLLDNSNFYSVDRVNHKHKNSIGFSGLNAIDRGEKFHSLGFVKNKISFNKYKINHGVRKTIKDKLTYKSAITSILSFKPGAEKELNDNIINIVGERKGFHVFYLTVTEGFHTLLLVIEYTDKKSSKYTIYDQHGITSSRGNLNTVADGILRQSKWTFANTCLNRYTSHTLNNNDKHLKWDGTNTFLWKIQRK